MTINEADTILSCERLDSSMGCGASDEDIDKALEVAMDIMCKYQKIEEIYKNWSYGADSCDCMKDIERVILYGDND